MDEARFKVVMGEWGQGRQGRRVCGVLLARVRRMRLVELSKKKAYCFSCCAGQQRRVGFAADARQAWRGLGEQRGCSAGQGLNALKGKSKQEGKGLEHLWRPALVPAMMQSLPHCVPRPLLPKATRKYVRDG